MHNWCAQHTMLQLVCCAHQDTATPCESVHSTPNFSQCNSHPIYGVTAICVLCTPLFLECVFVYYDPFLESLNSLMVKYSYQLQFIEASREGQASGNFCINTTTRTQEVCIMKLE